MNIKSKSHQYHTYTCQSNYSHSILHNSNTFHGHKHHVTKIIIHFMNDQLIPSNLKAYSNYTFQGDKHLTLCYSCYKTYTLFASWMINSLYLIFEILLLLLFTAAQNTPQKNKTQRYENKTQFSTKHNYDLQERRGEVGVIDKFSKWRSMKFILILQLVREQ